MPRRPNWFLWIGCLVLIVGFLSAPLLLGPPALRDLFPWPNLVIMMLGAMILGTGLVRAFGRPQVYRGRILGSLFGLLACAGIGFFFFVAYIARQIPASISAPQVGQRAPDFVLPDQDGKQMALTDLLRDRRAALLIFYRGHW